jgi:DNA-binding XRE family transcriptional regulator
MEEYEVLKQVNSGNQVKRIRESKMMSKAELARKTGLSVQTIDRIEKGHICRLDTKRKILLALGLKLEDRKTVFNDDDE